MDRPDVIAYSDHSPTPGGVALAGGNAGSKEGLDPRFLWCATATSSHLNRQIQLVTAITP